MKKVNPWQKFMSGVTNNMTGKLDMSQLEKLKKEVETLQKKQKKEIAEKEKLQRVAALAEEEAAKEAEIEKKKKEAEEKGQDYQDDEAFFAGME